MELTQIAAAMEQLIQRMSEGVGRKLKEAAERKAKGIAEYDKTIAITLIRLRAGEVFELEGHMIKDPPVSIMEKLAKGICWKECLEMERAEALYKNAVIWQETTCAQLNGYQSIFRHLEVTSR